MTVAVKDRDPSAIWQRDAKSDAPALQIEKFPQFNATLEQFGDTIGDMLAPMCGPGVTGSIEAMEPTTTFGFLDAHVGEPAALMMSARLEARALMVVDPGAVEVLIGAMFNVNPSLDSDAARTIAPRDRTNLETRLLGEYSKKLITCLDAAFRTTAPIDLTFDTFSNIAGGSLLGRNDQPAISVRYAIKTNAGIFGLLVVLPRNFTSALAALYAKGPDPSTIKPDPQWSEGIERGVSQTLLHLSAILDEFTLTLGDVAHLEVGQVLPLSGAGEGRIRIECAERGVFVCMLGERNERYALEVEDILPLPSESLPAGLI